MDRKEFLTALLLIGVAYLDFYFPQPLLANMAESLHVTDTSAGLVITGMIIPFIIAPFTYGHILRITGLRRLLFILMPISAISMMLPVLLPSYRFLLLCRILQGITLPGILVCLSAHTALRHKGSPLQRSMALYSTIVVLSAYLGRILGDAVAPHLDWSGTFAIFSLIQLAACVPMVLHVKDVREKTRARPSSALPTSCGSSGTRPSFPSCSSPR